MISKLFKIILICMLITAFSYNITFAESEMPVKTTSEKNTIRIISISPELAIPLHVGSDVTIEVQIEYELVDDSAEIAMTIQRGESGHMPVAYATELVTKGKERNSGDMILNSSMWMTIIHIVEYGVPRILFRILILKTYNNSIQRMR